MLAKIMEFVANENEWYVPIDEQALQSIFGETYEKNTIYLEKRDRMFLIFEEKQLYFCSIQLMREKKYLVKNSRTQMYVTKFTKENFEAIVRLKEQWEKETDSENNEKKKKELALFDEILLHKDYRLRYLFPAF